MGSSSDKNQKQNKYKVLSSDQILKENKYKCTIKLDETEAPGFLCDFRYLGQKKLVPTIITYKNLFQGKFNFKEENKFISIRYDYKHREIISEIKCVIYDNYNIVIFQISDLNDFSYLKIYKENPSSLHSYKLYDLINSFNILLDCQIEYIMNNNKAYIFYYYEKKKEKYKKYKNSLILNKYNDIIGITIETKNYKGITINGIIKEIKKNQKDNKENDKKKNNDIVKSNCDDKNNVFIHKDKKINANKDNFNNQNAYKEELILTNKNNGNKLNNNSEYRVNKGFINLKNTDNKKGKNIIFDDNKNNIYEKIKKPGKEKEKEKEKVKEEKFNVVKFIEKDVEKDIEKDVEKDMEKNIENEKEISLYFLFKNRKELYLDAKESFSFEQVINQLNEKYLWLKNIEIKEYQFENRKISDKKSLKQNGLKDNSTIYIIE